MPARSIALPLLAAVALCAQSPKQGITPEWGIRQTLEGIAANASRLLPVLEQIDPATWKGASEGYIAQMESCRAQARALALAARDLARSPEKLSSQLEAYFRLQFLESSLRSLGEGIRRYQNPALADLVLAMLAENGANRERIERYIVDLAAEKEQYCAVADREAQRCRGAISRQPARGERAPK
ncbi:MAG: hypothetical protein FJW37_13990 [Acidobacteria bacterium]|nr:hypothetical protein [Acidobacteriota bacterium]